MLPSEMAKAILAIPSGENTNNTIEEYDETVDGCDWHIRKWSSGYCEFSGFATYKNLQNEETWGSLFLIHVTSAAKFPFALKQKYVDISYQSRPIINTVGALTFPGNSDLLLDRAQPFSLVRGSSFTSDRTSYMYHFVTGRWK